MAEEPSSVDESQAQKSADDQAESPPDQLTAVTAERDALREERDKLVSMRDALLREVLPLAPRGDSEERRPRRWGLLLVVLLMAGAIGVLLYKSSRTMQQLQGQSGAERRRPRTHIGTPRPPIRRARARRSRRRAAVVRPKRVAIIPLPGVSVVGRTALAKDGRRAAIGGFDGTLLIYDLRLDHPVARLRGHQGAVRAVRFVDGDRLVTGGYDGRVVLWSMRRRAPLRVLRGSKHLGRDAKPPLAPVRDLAVGGGRVVVAVEGDAIEVYPLSGGKGRKLVGHRGWVRAVALDAHGKLLASGGHDKVIRLWQLPEGKLLRTLAGHRLWVNALAFAPNGKTLASAGFDKRTRLWDVESGKRLHSLRGHWRRPVALAFDRSGRRLASASLDRTVILWDVAGGKLLSRLRGHRYQVSSVAFGPGDSYLLTASTDGTLRLWGKGRATPRIWSRLSRPRAGELTLRSNHTGERMRIKVVDAKGKALAAGREQLAYMLRSGPDDLRKLPDPRLVELLYRTASHFGRQREIVLISGHRSALFNKLRAKQSKQVAKQSRHVRGQAIDFRISGVAITTLHRWLKKKRWGGLGLYPDSNFVHLDTGPVRLWQGN
jgi:WD40 repeat protein